MLRNFLQHDWPADVQRLSPLHWWVLLRDGGAHRTHRVVWRGLLLPTRGQCQGTGLQVLSLGQILPRGGVSTPALSQPHIRKWNIPVHVASPLTNCTVEPRFRVTSLIQSPQQHSHLAVRVTMEHSQIILKQ